MKKRTHHNRQPQQATTTDRRPGIISPAGRKTIAAGSVLVILGYVVLTRVDPAGQNWAGTLAPFLILGGYLGIGLGIMLPGSPPVEEHQS
jgi:hypothetical protein